MTVLDLKERCHLREITCGGELWEKEITGCYIGDLLSWAMGRIQPGSVWITVMGHVNAIAVAVLADAACVILPDGAVLDEEAEEKARQQGVAVFACEESGYQLAVRLAGFLE